jgi:hypothetical protein
MYALKFEHMLQDFKESGTLERKSYVELDVYLPLRYDFLVQIPSTRKGWMGVCLFILLDASKTDNFSLIYTCDVAVILL